MNEEPPANSNSKDYNANKPESSNNVHDDPNPCLENCAIGSDSESDPESEEQDSRVHSSSSRLIKSIVIATVDKDQYQTITTTKTQIIDIDEMVKNCKENDGKPEAKVCDYSSESDLSIDNNDKEDYTSSVMAGYDQDQDQEQDPCNSVIQRTVTQVRKKRRQIPHPYPNPLIRSCSKMATNINSRPNLRVFNSSDSEQSLNMSLLFAQKRKLIKIHVMPDE